MLSSRQPGMGGGHDCCRQMMSPRKQKQKSQWSSRGICWAETYTLPSKRHAPGAMSASSTSVGVAGEVGPDDVSKLAASMLLALSGISETVAAVVLDSAVSAVAVAVAVAG